MFTKKYLAPALLLALFTAACNKEKPISETDRQNTEAAAVDYLAAQQVFDGIFQEVDAQAKQQGKLNGFKDAEDQLENRGNCPDVGFEFTENTVFPATMTLDYGDGCNKDGNKLIAGKITAVFNGLLLSEGTSITLAYTDFAYAGHEVSGTYEIANLGKDANDQPTFQSTIDGQLTTPEGKSFAYQAVTTTKQTEGNDTNFFTNGLAGILDDVWSTTREATLTTSEGVVVHVATPSPIQNPLSCQWPVSGFFELDVNNPETTATIDFGDGSCDDKAVLTIGDDTIELDL